VIGADGSNPLRRFVLASKGRMIATAFGTYDYTAANNITAKYQDMGHAVCDFAHMMMKVSLGATGIWLSDGATNVMPIGPHRGAKLTPKQRAENKAVVHRNWKKAYDHTRHSLWKGLYQGWDLNPAQFPMRYAAVYSFFLESYDDAAARLKAFVERAARATLTSDVFDDAATGQGLLNYFLARPQLRRHQRAGGAGHRALTGGDTDALFLEDLGGAEEKVGRLGVPRLKCSRVGLSAISPHSSFLLACGLSASIPHAKCRLAK
jgi:hypothetical protein